MSQTTLTRSCRAMTESTPAACKGSQIAFIAAQFSAAQTADNSLLQRRQGGTDIGHPMQWRKGREDEREGGGRKGRELKNLA